METFEPQSPQCTGAPAHRAGRLRVLSRSDAMRTSVLRSFQMSRTRFLALAGTAVAAAVLLFASGAEAGSRGGGNRGGGYYGGNRGGGYYRGGYYGGNRGYYGGGIGAYPAPYYDYPY